MTYESLCQGLEGVLPAELLRPARWSTPDAAYCDDQESTGYPSDRGDAATLDAAALGLDAAGPARTVDRPAELVADNGFHIRAVLKVFGECPWQTRIAEPKPKEAERWRGDLDSHRAVYGNRARLRSGIG